MGKAKEIRSVLFSPDFDSSEDREALLRQYMMCVEMADRVSSRRQTANAFYLTATSTILAIVSALGDLSVGHLYGLLGAFVGVAFSFLWHRGIQSYADLNSGKFSVILAMEDEIRIRPYRAEWDVLERGHNNKTYRPFKVVEQTVPLVFLFIFVFISLAELYSVKTVDGVNVGHDLVCRFVPDSAPLHG
jgi:hypothetical protein